MNPGLRVALVFALAAALAVVACGAAEAPTQSTAESPDRPAPEVLTRSPADSRARPNIVLITLESLRTDHVGAYGGRSGTRPEEPITPTLDALAQESVLFERAHSVTSWTLSAHASLFTGLYPSAHQTRRPLSRLGDSYETLAERLGAAGYQTAAVVSGPYLREKYNLTQGFEHVDDSSANPFQPRAHSDVTNPGMERGLIHFVERRRDDEKPFFLFAYFWDPHYDFLPPEPYDRTFVSDQCKRIDLHEFDTSARIHAGIEPEELAFVLSQYDGEIRSTDALLGRFFDLLRVRGLWDDTLVIVTADHGEEFFDHGEKGHKKNLYDETVHVPLFVKLPVAAARRAAQLPGTRDRRLASLVDVAPTVFEIAGLAPGEPSHGRSLLADPDPARPILFELLAVDYLQRPGRIDAETESWVALRLADHKLVTRETASGQTRLELFDLSRDPQEKRNISAQVPERAAELRALLEEHVARARADGSRFEAGGEALLDEREREQLCALGYLCN